MRYGYYVTERPPMPGTIPAKGLEEVEEFDSRKLIKEAGCRAWGIAYYSRKLDDKEVYEYELKAMKEDN